MIHNSFPNPLNLIQGQDDVNSFLNQVQDDVNS